MPYTQLRIAMIYKNIFQIKISIVSQIQAAFSRKSKSSSMVFCFGFYLPPKNMKINSRKEKHIILWSDNIPLFPHLFFTPVEREYKNLIHKMKYIISKHHTTPRSKKTKKSKAYLICCCTIIFVYLFIAIYSRYIVNMKK